MRIGIVLPIAEADGEHGTPSWSCVRPGRIGPVARWVDACGSRSILSDDFPWEMAVRGPGCALFPKGNGCGEWMPRRELAKTAVSDAP